MCQSRNLPQFRRTGYQDQRLGPLVELPSHPWKSQLPNTHDMEINCLNKKVLYKFYTEKCCLFSYNSEIINYTISRSPDLNQINTMLERTFPDKYYDGTILHSDHGW